MRVNQNLSRGIVQVDDDDVHPKSYVVFEMEEEKQRVLRFIKAFEELYGRLTLG